MESSSTHVIKTRNPFAVPSGWPGRLAGRLMAKTTDQHEEIFESLALSPGVRLLEIGYGPGQLVRLICERDASAIVAGIDPSRVMYEQAVSANEEGIGRGQVDLRVATAASIPFADGDFDYVVAVNNVPIWPDVGAGLQEAHRVLRDGGVLAVAWHGARSPRFVQRKLALPESKLATLHDQVRAQFGDVEHRRLRYSELFVARR